MSGLAIVRRYWIENSASLNGDEITISGDSFHHIFEVCREGVGSQFEILNGSLESLVVEVLSKTKKTAIVRVNQKKQVSKLPSPQINLFISMPKIPTFEAVLEKSVELGVAKIQPFTSEFSFLKGKDMISNERLLRWNKIIRSACEQSYRSQQLVVNPLCKFEETFSLRNERNFSIFAYEGPGKGVVESLNNKKLTEATEIDIFIGSEGGFSQTEVEVFAQNGLNPISLGSQILRVETACISIISILKYSSGHFN